MALLTASRHALLNDMLQREHIRVFIGLKLDMETIPKCRMHENNNDGGKKRNTDQMLFFKISFISLIHYSAANLYPAGLASTEID